MKCYINTNLLLPANEIRSIFGDCHSLSFGLNSFFSLVYAFNVLILWIHLWWVSSRPNVKMVLGGSTCLLLLPWPCRQEMQHRLLLVFDVLLPCHYGMWVCGLCMVLCVNGVSFGCECLTSSGLLYLVCRLFVRTVETVHREEESHVFHRIIALMSSLCGQELIHGFFCLLLLRSARQLSFFFPFPSFS